MQKEHALECITELEESYGYQYNLTQRALVQLFLEIEVPYELWGELKYAVSKRELYNGQRIPFNSQLAKALEEAWAAYETNKSRRMAETNIRQITSDAGDPLVPRETIVSKLQKVIRGFDEREWFSGAIMQESERSDREEL